LQREDWFRKTEACIRSTNVELMDAEARLILTMYYFAEGTVENYFVV
jgi:hypothetical protein